MTNNSITINRVLSLGEAVRLTGFSAGKFRYNKALLEESGVVVSAAGWEIPYKVLESLGWLGVKEPKTDVAPTALALARSRVAELEAEVARLNKELASAQRPRLFGRKR